MMISDQNSRFLKGLMILSFLSIMAGCDLYHKNKCEWYLVPEPKHVDRVEPGWVALCARNFEINKQRCNLKAPLAFSKKVFNKPFRYSSLKVKPGRYPKEVESITLCQANET
jgi:hypothetical protein